MTAKLKSRVGSVPSKASLTGATLERSLPICTPGPGSIGGKEDLAGIIGEDQHRLGQIRGHRFERALDGAEQLRARSARGAPPEVFSSR